MANILALLRDLGKSPVAWDLFIKLDNICEKIVMLDLWYLDTWSGFSKQLRLLSKSNILVNSLSPKMN